MFAEWDAETGADNYTKGMAMRQVRMMVEWANAGETPAITPEQYKEISEYIVKVLSGI